VRLVDEDLAGLAGPHDGAADEVVAVDGQIDRIVFAFDDWRRSTSE
jgi:hypothetical protein